MPDHIVTLPEKLLKTIATVRWAIFRLKFTKNLSGKGGREREGKGGKGRGMEPPHTFGYGAACQLSSSTLAFTTSVAILGQLQQFAIAMYKLHNFFNWHHIFHETCRIFLSHLWCAASSFVVNLLHWPRFNTVEERRSVSSRLWIASQTLLSCECHISFPKPQVHLYFLVSSNIIVSQVTKFFTFLHLQSTT